MSIIQSAERVSNTTPSDNYLFQRSLLAYKHAAAVISGKVLEIGTGSGYGVAEIAPMADEFWTIDKHDIEIDYNTYTNTRFIKTKVPPFKNIPSGYFDYVICFQVIEHIPDTDTFLAEIERVLKPKGSLIVSTPNRLMSLTRNPWHIREYTFQEFGNLLGKYFEQVSGKGVFGNEDAMKYYNDNKRMVSFILSFDIFRFNRWLPRTLLQIPYDLFNRISRISLLKKNKELTQSFSSNSFMLEEVSSECFDLYYIAQKGIPELKAMKNVTKSKRNISF